MILETHINNILANTRDPHSQLSGIDLNLKVKLTQEDKTLHLDLLAGFPCALLKQGFVPSLEQALRHALPDYPCQIRLDSFIQAHRTQLTGQGLRGVKNTIAVASGKGGVGKSTVAVHVASALAQAGARVGLLDADIYGPSIPTLLGAVEPVETLDEHYLPVRAHGMQAMSIGYLTETDSALIWRGPMLAKALIQMLDLTLWDNLDYLFIDLPPGTGDIQLSLVQKIPLTGAIIVTTPQTVATMDAQKAMQMFARTQIDVLGLVENMSIHTCRHCGHQDTLFGHGGAATLCASYHTALLGQLPLDPSIGRACDGGYLLTDPSAQQAFETVALAASSQLSKRPLNFSSKFPPIVVEKR